ncbi:MAG: iron ABC transporter permease [Candidatus Omnitrophota bacterium]
MPKTVIAICLSVFCVIVIAPLLLLLFNAITSVPLSSFLLEARQLNLLKNSLVIGIGTALFALILGIPYAFFLTRTSILFKQGFLLAGLIPLFLPAQITTIGWLKLMGTQGLDLGFKLYGLGGIVFILGLSYFPFVVLLTLTGLNSMDPKLEQAGELTCSRAKVFTRITLPLLLPYIFSGAIFVFIFSIANYGVPDLLRVNTYPVEIFVQFSAFYNTQKAVILAIPLILITLGLILLQRHLMAERSYVTLRCQKGIPHYIDSAKIKWLGIVFCSFVFILSVVVPMLMLIIGAGPIATYAAAFKTAQQQIFNSLFFAVIAATFICIICFPLAYVIQRASKRFSLFVDIVSMLPFAIPSAIFGIALIKFWNHPQTNFIYQTFLIVVFGYTVRFSAFAIRTMSASISQIHRNLEESAGLVPISWFKRFWKILFPLSGTGILASWVLCFSLAMGELGTTLLVIPAGEATMPIRIYTLMHYGAHKLVCGLCVLLVMIILLPGIILFIMHNWRQRRKKAKVLC